MYHQRISLLAEKQIYTPKKIREHSLFSDLYSLGKPLTKPEKVYVYVDFIHMLYFRKIALV